MKSLRTMDLCTNHIHLLPPQIFIPDTLEEVKRFFCSTRNSILFGQVNLSNNNDLNSALVTAARRGPDALLDYVRSAEYAELYKDVGEQ